MLFAGKFFIENPVKGIEIIGHFFIAVPVGKITEIIKTAHGIAVPQMIRVGGDVAAIGQLTEKFLITLAVIAHTVGKLDDAFYFSVRKIRFAVYGFPFLRAGKGKFFHDHNHSPSFVSL